MDDPTKVRNQPALTTSSGKSWLVLGGLLTAISVVVLALLFDRRPPGVAMVGIIVTLVLYAVMIAVRLTTDPGRLRLGLMAASMISIGVVALICVIVILNAEVAPL